MNTAELTREDFRKGFGLLKRSRVIMIIGIVMMALFVISLFVTIIVFMTIGLDKPIAFCLSTTVILMSVSLGTLPVGLPSYIRYKKNIKEINAFIDKVGEQNFMYEIRNAVYYSNFHNGAGEIITRSFVIDLDRMAMFTADISFVVVECIGEIFLTRPKYPQPSVRIHTLSNKTQEFMWRKYMDMMQFQPVMNALYRANPSIMFGNTPEIRAEHQRRIQAYSMMKN